MGLFKEAEEYLQQALKRDPDNPSIYSNLGNLYRAQQDFEKAQEMYEQGLHRLPDHGDLQNGLIALAVDQEKYDEAVKRAQETLKKPYRQKFLKAQTYVLLAHAHLGVAKLLGQEGKKVESEKSVESARQALQGARPLLENPRALLPVEEEIQEFVQHQQSPSPQPSPTKSSKVKPGDALP
jgi:tetratricopeptide (TPR) repeat protein